METGAAKCTRRGEVLVAKMPVRWWATQRLEAGAPTRRSVARRAAATAAGGGGGIGGDGGDGGGNGGVGTIGGGS